MDAIAVPLRQRQAEQVRSAVLEAVLAQLEDRAVDEMSMADVARSAGISLRTLYRHFPDRGSLLQAAGEHLYRSLAVRVAIAGADDIVSSFQHAAARLATRPKLTRALIRTEAGRQARSAMRGERVEAVRRALEPLTAGVEGPVARGATALIAHLCSATSWVSIADESGISDGEARAAVSWGIAALVETLRRTARDASRAGSTPARSKRRSHA